MDNSNAVLCCVFLNSRIPKCSLDAAKWGSYREAKQHLVKLDELLPRKWYCSVQFLSHPQSEGWPHHGRTFFVYLYPLSF